MSFSRKIIINSLKNFIENNDYKGAFLYIESVYGYDLFNDSDVLECYIEFLMYQGDLVFAKSRLDYLINNFSVMANDCYSGYHSHLILLYRWVYPQGLSALLNLFSEENIKSLSDEAAALIDISVAEASRGYGIVVDSFDYKRIHIFRSLQYKYWPRFLDLINHNTYIHISTHDFYANFSNEAGSIFNKIQPYYFQEIANKERLVVIDHSIEGIVLTNDLCEKILDYFVGFKFIGDYEIFIIDQNRANSSLSLANENLKLKVNFIHYDYFPLELVRRNANIVTPSDDLNWTKVTRRFSILNGAPREHRVLLMAKLLADDVLQNFNYTWFGRDSIKKIDFDNVYFHQFDSDLMYFVNLVLDWGRFAPELELNVDQHSMPFLLSTDFLHSGYFHVVSETGFGSGLSQRISEKSLKPIFANRPFLIYGEPMSVATLRDWGFCVFDEVIDHSYDLEFNPILRFSMFISELKRLANLKIDYKVSNYIDNKVKFNSTYISNEFADFYLSKLISNTNKSIS